MHHRWAWAQVAITVVVLCVLGLFGVANVTADRDGVSIGHSKLVPESGYAAAGLLYATDVFTVRQYLPLVLNGYVPPYDTLFGVQLYGTINEQAQALRTMRSAYVHWARWPIAWSAIEPTNRLPDQYVWYADASISNAYLSNLELIATIVNNPAWAATYPNGPIDKTDLSEFAQFMAAMVERYDGDGVSDAPGSPVVRYWELYNEPDAGIELNAAAGHSYWGPFGAEYAAMLCSIYPAMKAASSDVQVVLGGIAYDNFLDSGGVFVRAFLGDVLDAGGGACFDVMNFHYYPPFEPIWSAYGPGLSGKAAFLRQNYPIASKPMMVTEAGWHSADYSIYPSSPAMQARYVVKLFTQAMYADLQALTWWTWIDPGGGYAENGLLTLDLVPKVSYSVYQDAAARIGRSTFEAAVDVGSADVEAYRFMSAGSQPFYVLWSIDEFVRSVSVPLVAAQVRNMYGTPTLVVWDYSDGSIDGRIHVSVGQDPVYVEAYP